MSTIYDKLKDYSDSDYYGFHMPGHKRNLDMLKSTVPYKIDITEIEGFDDLHHAEGILKEAQIRAARIYHADETHFLINGSTVGILSAIAGVTKKGDTILVARNCHKSVYHAIYMNELNPVYLYPDFNHCAQLNTEVSVDDVREALDKYPSIRAVVIVSPTYDGVVSDVEAIAEAVHEKGIPLIVDEAHGAHFGFHPYFPQNANTRGADIVIHSGTKFLGGHNDTLAGFIVTNNEEVQEKLRFIIKTTGAGLAPFDCWLILRGIKTLGIRMERSQENAIKIANWLKEQPVVKHVYYPGLQEHPGYEIMKKQARGFGAMLTFDVDTEAHALQILESVRMIKFAESLGGVETLITYPTTQTHADVPEEVRLKNGITPCTLRVSVGIEDIEDLLAELSGVFQSLK